MSLREIRLHPDPVLREKCEPVTAFDDELRQLVRDMAETMYAAPGIGIAAPQIGVTKRIFVIDVREADPTGEPRLRVFINPEFVHKEGEIVWEEGCLSIPEIHEEVRRAASVTIKAHDEFGEPFELSADDLLAVAMQHEYDHIEGVLFIDHLSPLKRKLAWRRYERLSAKLESRAQG